MATKIVYLWGEQGPLFEAPLPSVTKSDFQDWKLPDETDPTYVTPYWGGAKCFPC